MTDKTITSIWTPKRFKGPEPKDISVSYSSIMPAFAANGRIRTSVTNYRGLEVSTPEDLENNEWWGSYWNPGFYGDIKDAWMTTADVHAPTDVGTYAVRGFYQRKGLTMNVGVDYDERAWAREALALRRNMYATMEQEIIGDHSATNTGEATTISTVLDSPGTNNDAAGRPALLPSDADGGSAGCLTDISGIKLGASGTINTLINTIAAVFSAVGIDIGKERLALFVPPAAYPALGILQAESGLADRSLGKLQSAFKGGVWSTEWFHSRTDSDASSATDFDLTVIDMDRVEIAVLGGGIREVLPKTYFVDGTEGTEGYKELLDLWSGVKFDPVYDGSTYYKAVAVCTGGTTAAS